MYIDIKSDVNGELVAMNLTDGELFTIFCSMLSRRKTDFEPANKQISDMLISMWAFVPSELRDMCINKPNFKIQLDNWGVPYKRIQ